MNRFLVNVWIYGAVATLVALGARADDSQQQKSGSHESSPANVNQKNWPNFRGPNGLGRATQATPPSKWNAKDGTGILWKIALPKHGMSSPIVCGDRLFCTGADEDSRQLYCVDANTGKLRWLHDVDGVPGSPDDGKIPDVLEETGFAAPTPTSNGKYVAAVFATGELVCVDLKGNRIWIKHLGIPHNHYGHASSLLSHENLLFVQYDQKENSQVLAFDILSGKQAWQAKRGAMSWSSPILTEHNGKKQLVLTDSKAVEGYEPKSGKSLWRVECLSGEVASSAAYSNGKVFVANERAPAAAINISEQEPRISWQWDESLPDAASPVASDNYVIVPTAFGVVSCLDARSGKLLWEHEFDQGFSSSPILVGELVYIIDLSGNVQIFKMDRKFELVGTADIGEPVYATPAFFDDRIYVRSLGHLFCIREQSKSSSE